MYFCSEPIYSQVIITVFTRLNAAFEQTSHTVKRMRRSCEDYNKKLNATWLPTPLDNYDSLSAKKQDMGTLTLT